MRIYIFCYVAISIVYPALGQSNIFQKADSLYFQSNWRGAISAYEKLLQDNEATPVGLNRLGYAYHNLQQHDKAMAIYNQVLGMSPPKQVSSTVQSRIARIYSSKKEERLALDHLEKAITLGYMNLQEMESNPDFDFIRNHPRFKEGHRIATTNAFPCLSIAQAREFDFWLGEWDVYANGSNVLVGHSKVEMASGGCMILENWTAVGPVPNTGKSINYVNRATGKWEQHWVGSGGLNLNNPQLFINGEYREGAMRFEFQSVTPQNEKQMGRFIFFNLGPNQVRQFNETSSDGGKTWTTVYDFIYKRKN